MFTKKFLQPLCIGLILTTLLSLPQATAQLSNEQLQLIDARLNDIASLAALPLKSEVFRQILWEEAKESSDFRQKVDLDTIIEIGKELPGPTSPGIWSALQINVKSLRDAVSGVQAVSVVGQPSSVRIDLYFPVEKHRETWQPDDPNLLIAYAPVGDENPVDIIAYSAIDGLPVFLDPNEAPTIPTLVIGLREPEPNEPNPPMLELSGDVNAPPEGSAIVPDTSDTNSYIGIPWVKIRNDHEPWYKGDPEVYVRIIQTKADGFQKTITRNLGGVNDTNRWYWLGDGPSYPLYRYYNSGYGKITRFVFMEEDWPDSDDHMGTLDLHRDDLGYADYKWYRAGDVDVFADKDP